jgi:hypothetical protein
MYSKYNPSTYNVVPQIQKAYSPHRYPDNNTTKGGTHSFTNTNHVGCMECHPSHGSGLVSGNSGTGAFSGGPDTSTGATGGIMLAAENSINQTGDWYDGVGNPTYTTEEQLCWGCHPDGMDYRGDDSDTSGTDLTEWQGTWDNSVHTIKTGGFRSSHFYPNRDSMANSWSTTPSGDRTNVSCSTCHDPHGVDSAGTFPDYRVPILRGTWLTSPYLEDSPPDDAYATGSWWDWRPQASNSPSGEVKGARIAPDLALNRSPYKGHGYASNSGSGLPGYFIDDNTFGVYGGNSTTDSGQDAGLWWDHTPDANPVTNGNAGSKQNVKVKHMDSVSTWPGGTETQNITAYDGVTNMTVGANLSANRVAGLCEACHGFTTSTSLTTSLGSYSGHRTVVGIGNRDNGWNSWSKMFTRPYMHMKHRYDWASETDGDGSAMNPYVYLVDCSRGDPKDRAGYHDGACGYHWGVDPEPQRSAQPGYHKFSCSKCHTPHASRLPRLMQTNCLDIGTNEGNDSTSGSIQVKRPRLQGGSAYGYPWADDSGQDSLDSFFDRYWSSQGPSGAAETEDIAVTCHANGSGVTGAGAIFGDGQSSGWNNVTPW